MSNRNPVAGNAWKYNRSSVVPDKRNERKQRSWKRYYETDYDEVQQ